MGDSSDVQRAWLRLILGILQMSLALAAFVHLFRAGPKNARSVAAVAVVTALTIASRRLFRESPKRL